MSSSLPPEGRPKVQPFDPLVLDRTVIAVPLLKAMESDLAQIRLIELRYPKASDEFNAAVQLDPDFEGGPDQAYRAVEKMAMEAAQLALQASERRLARIKEDLKEPYREWQKQLLEATR